MTSISRRESINYFSPKGRKGFSGLKLLIAISWGILSISQSTTLFGGGTTGGWTGNSEIITLEIGDAGMNILPLNSDILEAVTTDVAWDAVSYEDLIAIQNSEISNLYADEVINQEIAVGISNVVSAGNSKNRPIRIVEVASEIEQIAVEPHLVLVDGDGKKTNYWAEFKWEVEGTELINVTGEDGIDVNIVTKANSKSVMEFMLPLDVQ